MRMPTVRREDWISSECCGDDKDSWCRSPCQGMDVLSKGGASLVKKEVIDAWKRRRFVVETMLRWLIIGGRR